LEAFLFNCRSTSHVKLLGNKSTINRLTLQYFFADSQ